MLAQTLYIDSGGTRDTARITTALPSNPASTPRAMATPRRAFSSIRPTWEGPALPFI